MIKNAIILHGTGGSPDSNWFRWLEKALTSKGLDVWVPELPNPQLPSLTASAAFVQTQCPFAVDDHTLIVGHSSGAILALVLAQQGTGTIGAVVGVSVFHDNSLGWDKNARLFDVPFDFAAIQEHVRTLFFIHSDTDPYVPLEQAQYVANNCQAELIVWPGQGHFNLEQSPDYIAFPALLHILGQRVLGE